MISANKFQFLERSRNVILFLLLLQGRSMKVCLLVLLTFGLFYVKKFFKNVCGSFLDACFGVWNALLPFLEFVTWEPLDNLWRTFPFGCINVP